MIVIRLKTGRAIHEWRPTSFGPDETVETLELFWQNPDGELKPVVRQRFAVHGGPATVHSICRREGDEIDVVEW